MVGELNCCSDSGCPRNLANRGHHCAWRKGHGQVTRHTHARPAKARLDPWTLAAATKVSRIVLEEY